MSLVATRRVPVLFWVFLVALIPMVGVAVALAGPVAALVAIAATAVVVVMSMSLQHVLLLELILSTMVAGLIEYFGHIGQAQWIPYLLGLLLGFRALVDRLGLTRRAPGVRGGDHVGPSLISIAAATYLITILASSLINLPPFIQVVVGVKNYLFMWGILAAFLVARDTSALANKVWAVLIFTAIAQLPVVLYQYLFVASKRSAAGGASGVAWDAIVGTFGGDPAGGGHSAAMALFVAIVLLALLIQWRDGRRSFGSLATIAALALPSVFLAEVKAIVIWLAIGSGVVFARSIFSRPLVFVGGTVGMLGLLAALVFAYNTLYYGQGKELDLQSLYDKQVAYVFDTQKFNAETREMGRVASISYWWQQHTIDDPGSFLIGHGIGSSRGSSTVAVGEVARRYSFYIDTSAVTTQLWDIGLLGAIAFAAVLLIGTIYGLRMARDKSLDLESRGNAETAGVGLLLILLGLPYNRDAIDSAAVQFLMFFLLAQILITMRRGGSKSTPEPRYGR